jgi:hypothetical protein
MTAKSICLKFFLRRCAIAHEGGLAGLHVRQRRAAMQRCVLQTITGSVRDHGYAVVGYSHNRRAWQRRGRF